MKAESYILRNQLTLDDLKNQIEITSFKLNLGQFAVEKDLYVTEIIHAISKLEHDCYRLVFQGGTCLAKAHKVIPRMSEDCDFRIEAKSPAFNLSKEKARNELRGLRREIENILDRTGFIIEKDAISVRDEGRFVNMRLRYESLYDQQVSLKPFMAVDFFLADVKSPTIDLPVTTLVKNTLGSSVNHPEETVKCLSITETAAEKWIGLTRRIATIEQRQYYNDPSLVRHIYDLYKINEFGKLGLEFTTLVTNLLVTEIDKFKTQNANYASNPAEEIKNALQILNTKEWRQNWERFVNDMVFELNPPSYEKALQNLNSLSEQCLLEVQKSRFVNRTSTFPEINRNDDK